MTDPRHGDTRELAHYVGEWISWLCETPFTEFTPVLCRLERDLGAAADTGHELPEETLKAARDFLGVLVGR